MRQQNSKSLERREIVLEKTGSKRGAVRRIAEVAAVFLGVGLAFIADNVREDFQEEAAAKELAAGMLEDLEATRSDLTSVRDRTRRKTEASLEAREHLRSSEPTISLDSLSQLLAISAARFDRHLYCDPMSNSSRPDCCVASRSRVEPRSLIG